MGASQHLPPTPSGRVGTPVRSSASCTRRLIFPRILRIRETGHIIIAPLFRVRQGLVRLLDGHKFVRRLFGLLRRLSLLLVDVDCGAKSDIWNRPDSQHMWCVRGGVRDSFRYARFISGSPAPRLMSSRLYGSGSRAHAVAPRSTKRRASRQRRGRHIRRRSDLGTHAERNNKSIQQASAELLSQSVRGTGASRSLSHV